MKLINFYTNNFCFECLYITLFYLKTETYFNAFITKATCNAHVFQSFIRIIKNMRLISKKCIKMKKSKKKIQLIKFEFHLNRILCLKC